MIVLSYRKDQLKLFLVSLPTIIGKIKEKTDGRVFVPTVLQNSPVSPSTQMLIVMRDC